MPKSRTKKRPYRYGSTEKSFVVKSRSSKYDYPTSLGNEILMEKILKEKGPK